MQIWEEKNVVSKVCLPQVLSARVLIITPFKWHCLKLIFNLFANILGVVGKFSVLLNPIAYQ